MKVSEKIAEALVSEGVTLAAGISGQSIGRLLDAIANRPEVTLMYTRQERVAFDICDGFARASGRPAVVFTDAGPAAANLMGGLVNSWGDSVPVLFFAGHNDRSEQANRQTKEIPFIEMFRPVSKWTTIIDYPDQTDEVIRRAFMHLTTGRPGPVVIGMPYDVSDMLCKPVAYQAIQSRRRVRSGADPDAIADACRMILSAKRPYLYVGAGALFSEATNELVAFAEAISLPVATTLNGKSAFPETHHLSVGIGGFGRASYGSSAATKLARDADVIITIGCGFKRHATQVRPGAGVKHIQVDIDPTELNRDHLADVELLGDARVVLKQLHDQCVAMLKGEKVVSAEYKSEIRALKGEWDDLSRKVLESAEIPINPFRVTAEFNKLVKPEETIVLHDAGTVRGSTSQHYLTTTPRGFLGFGVQSAMGWSIGAAMGAKKAHPEKLVVAFIGEEAFNETALDIETSIRNDAPILIIVKNNRRYADTDGGKSQRLAHARFHTGVDISALAKALGAEAFEISDPASLAQTLKAAIATTKAGRTTVVDIRTARINGSLHRLWDPNAKAGGE